MKKLYFPLIALFMVSSMLAPSIVSILDKSCDIVLLSDTNEEENHGEKEGEKKFDEKDLFLNNLSFSSSRLPSTHVSAYSEYVLCNSDFVIDIPLPPPRCLS